MLNSEGILNILSLCVCLHLRFAGISVSGPLVHAIQVIGEKHIISTWRSFKRFPAGIA